ncbi:MAG: hypothetical protein GX606_06315 [Elusimicrobia bacterium]|nr:hypothetical protein [Elusimicrobiota bacterium]
MDKAYLALGIFLLAYVLFVCFSTRRSWIAVLGSVAVLLTGVLHPFEAFRAINWNVMGIFVGTLVVADLFMESRVPAYIAEILVDRSRNTAWAILAICGLTSFISAFVENVATVLIVAPIALEVSRKLKISPVGMMIALAISSNLQGTATLIGDPPSMLLAGFAKMNFGDFFFYQGRPSIFFAVQAGAVLAFTVLYFVFRRETAKVPVVAVEKVRSWVPTGMLVSLIVLLALSSFLDTGFSYMAGILCMVYALIGLLWDLLANRSDVVKRVRGLDWDTTLFLVGIFVLVGSLTITGWVDRTALFLSSMVGTNVFAGYSVLVLLAVLLSAFIDNVPFLAAMLPVAISMADKLGVAPQLFLFGLLIGASLGGNITPIGASANIVACGLLKKEGYPVGFREFGRIGIPFTIAAVFAAYLFVWFVWGR